MPAASDNVDVNTVQIASVTYLVRQGNTPNAVHAA